METRVLVGTAVSGGSLRGLLEEAIARCGAGQIALGLERLAMEFPLPCPSGVGRPLTPHELMELRKGQHVFFSSALCSKYFVLRRGEAWRFVLFDDEETVQKKAELARSLGITELFELYPFF